ncbi:MAG TPA: FKBP-type peptidyl-prolyl cis-trans isomerase [Candidatus Sulfotelmatobacter sp.]|nr:FKBP-type peptidyl-prolyl cis-trans isomerase [Candidatus Sulfotelmatobacter sp.]
MRKSLTIGTQLMTGMMLLGLAAAQQTPATPTTQPPSGQAAPKQAPAKTQTGTAVKKAPATAAPVTLKTQKDKESYAMGMNLGMGLHRQGMMLDPALVARGLKDSQSGAKTAMTEDEARTAMSQLQTEVRQKLDAKAKEEGAMNRKEGDAFLAANKGKDGVVALPSGLQYKILKAGSGPKPAATDTVTCNYRGTFISGREFDSSKPGQPISFPLNGVIKGWTEALQLMPVGSKWQLFIPGDLAYGDGGRPGIPPASTLIFEVELVSIGEQKK